jgi:hypothetical protein
LDLAGIPLCLYAQFCAATCPDEPEFPIRSDTDGTFERCRSRPQAPGAIGLSVHGPNNQRLAVWHRFPTEADYESVFEPPAALVIHAVPIEAGLVESPIKVMAKLPFGDGLDMTNPVVPIVAELLRAAYTLTRDPRFPEPLSWWLKG